MDPINTAIILSWVEVKAVCEQIVKDPDGFDITFEGLAQHVLTVMERHLAEAKPGLCPRG
jgi:hypothetical protein